MGYRIVSDNSVCDFDNGKFMFYVEIEFDNNINSYVYAGKFEIAIRDMLLHNVKDFVINSTDIVEGRYDMASDDIEENLVANGGIIVHRINDYRITLILSPLAEGTNNTIGFNASKVFFKFINDNDIIDDDIIEIEAAIFPRVERSPDLVQTDLTEDDPVLVSAGIRPAYDFGTAVTGAVPRDFGYNTTDSFYTNAIMGTSPTVPVYISTVSAYMPEGFPLTSATAGSFITNHRGTTVDIDYSIPEPVEYRPEILPGYTAALNVYEVEQVVYADRVGMYGNSLIFSVDIDTTDEE